jgi:hypothetical protein
MLGTAGKFRPSPAQAHDQNSEYTHPVMKADGQYPHYGNRSGPHVNTPHDPSATPWAYPTGHYGPFGAGQYPPAPEEIWGQSHSVGGGWSPGAQCYQSYY